MASSSMPEDGHDTPAAPINTPPGICTQLAFKNLRLNHEWEIGEKIPRENERHAAVYSVLISETGQAAENLEAHVFALDGIEPKLRKHQQRCIKRMKGRTELEVKVDDTTIVIISTSQPGNADASEHGVYPCLMSKEGQQETDGDTSSIRKMKQKSPYQLESQRIRQKERRQARRSAKTRQRDERTAEVRRKVTEAIIWIKLHDTEDELSMFEALLLQLLNAWDLWTAMPSKCIDLAKNIESSSLYEALEKYMVPIAVDLHTMQEMESFLKVRRSEIISLRCHQDKVLSAMIYHLDILVEIKRMENSDLMRETEDNPDKGRNRSKVEAEDELVLAGLANEIIGDILRSRRIVVWIVEHKLSIKSVEIVSDGSQGEINGHERKVPRNTGWAIKIARNRALRLVASAKIKLAACKRRFPSAVS